MHVKYYDKTKLDYYCVFSEIGAEWWWDEGGGYATWQSVFGSRYFGNR